MLVLLLVLQVLLLLLLLLLMMLLLVLLLLLLVWLLVLLMLQHSSHLPSPPMHQAALVVEGGCDAGVVSETGTALQAGVAPTRVDTAPAPTPAAPDHHTAVCVMRMRLGGHDAAGGALCIAHVGSVAHVGSRGAIV